MRSEQEARNRRVQEITEEIANLSAELQELLSIGADDQQVNRQAIPQTRQNRTRTRRVTVYQQEEQRPVQVGDRVQILNSYRGLRGERGTVTRFTTSRVWFDLDSTGENTFGEKQNLRRID